MKNCFTEKYYAFVRKRIKISILVLCNLKPKSYGIQTVFSHLRGGGGSTLTFAYQIYFCIIKYYLKICMAKYLYLHNLLLKTKHKETTRK